MFHLQLQNKIKQKFFTKRLAKLGFGKKNLFETENEQRTNSRKTKKIKF